MFTLRLNWKIMSLMELFNRYIFSGNICDAKATFNILCIRLYVSMSIYQTCNERHDILIRNKVI